ncbi:MAG: sugar phosphate isomerase/epimerase [Hyphomicrobiales bacterium]
MTDFSYQLYSSRNFPTLKGTLSMLAGLGYAEVEGYGALYADAAAVDELIANLGDSGLKMPTAHMSIDMVENDPARVLEIAKALGITTIYVPYLVAEDRPTDADGWRAFGKRLEQAGEPLRAAGLGFGWHNHDFEFHALPSGEIPMELVFEAAPSLQWEADIAWIVRGGGDPFDWIKRHGSKITSVHVKDIATEGEKLDEDGWADVGDGTMDWAGIMTAARSSTPAKHFIMEHDNPSDDKRFATRSLEAAKSF